MRPVFYKGVPFGNLQFANRLTIPGSLNDVNRYRFNRDLNEGAAMTAISTSLNRRLMPAGDNPYAASLAGLGASDDGNWQPSMFLSPAEMAAAGVSDTPMAPGSYTAPANTTSPWVGVLGVVANNISQGIAAKIGGYKPPGVPTLPLGYKAPTALSSIPTWAMVAGAGLVGLLVVKKMRRAA